MPYTRPNPRAIDFNAGFQRHISAECSPGGNGQCDGYDYDNYNKECACTCHGEWDLPDTVEGVSKWHDEENNVGDYRYVYYAGTERLIDYLDAIEQGIEFDEIKEYHR